MNKKVQQRYARAFGRNFRKLRIAAGLRRKDIDLAVGIDPSNLDKIETGKRISWLSMVPRLAKAINRHQRDLFDFYFDYDPDPVVSRKPVRKRTKSK